MYYFLETYQLYIYYIYIHVWVVETCRTDAIGVGAIAMRGPGLVSALPAPERWTWLDGGDTDETLIYGVFKQQIDLKWGCNVISLGFNEVHHQHYQFDMSLSGC
jgi:hypothetical protein